MLRLVITGTEMRQVLKVQVRRALSASEEKVPASSSVQQAISYLEGPSLWSRAHWVQATEGPRMPQKPMHIGWKQRPDPQAVLLGIFHLFCTAHGRNPQSRAKAGFSATSWVPSAFSRPCDTLFSSHEMIRHLCAKEFVFGPFLHRTSKASLHTFPGCVLIIFDHSGQAKISYFAHKQCRHQNVGSSEIPVDVVSLLYVSHAFCYLRRGEKYISSWGVMDPKKQSVERRLQAANSSCALRAILSYVGPAFKSCLSWHQPLWSWPSHQLVPM